MPSDSFLVALESLGLQLTQPQLLKFDEFEEALYRANEVMNLTRVPKEECWLRHFVDSLLFHDLIPHGAKVLDIGSGPGFPSWPLAVARPDLQIMALDSSGKMLGFLNKQPLPNLTTYMGRAEEWGVREEFDVVTGRAVAPLPLQMELSAAPLKIGGILLPMRTPAEKEEIEMFPAEKLGLEYKTSEPRTLPGTDVVRLFATFEKVDPTPENYPRQWSEMKRKPIKA